MMRKATILSVMLALLLTGCNGSGKLSGFWDNADVTVTEENYTQVQDRFAEFAELLAAKPEAVESLNPLFDKLKDNEVDYIIYTQWMEYAFHNYFSPCRNPAIFDAVVERIAADAILSAEETERMQKLAAQDWFNHTGDPCKLPEGVKAEGPALFLILNLDCRTCQQSLQALSNIHPEAAHIALCYGWSPAPSVPGWEYLKPEGMEEIFELEAAPFWFLTAADGTVEIPYSMEFEPQSFATPETL